MRQLLY